MDLHRILIAGLQGGGGKTFVSLGLVAAWRKRGFSVAPFKKGPDYIDASWLSTAADRPCRNLDAFLMEPQTVLRSFIDNAAGCDVAVIEGNRGLFDGMDAHGTYSTAELAKFLQTPIVLTVDCTKSTRTVAALVLGCQRLDPEAPIRGVVLNRVSGARHESVIRQAVEDICGIPVVGVIPRIPRDFLPERHLGLVPPPEHGRLREVISQITESAERYLDLDAIWSLALQAPRLEFPGPAPAVRESARHDGVRVGVFRDAAFQFYYPENLEALVREGAELIEISPLRDSRLPELDGLYIGGGFPETLAPTLAENSEFLGSVRRAAESGLPVYAECGGAVFLGGKLRFEGREYSMAGALPVDFAFRTKPKGHGYAELEVVEENPFLPVGTTMRGHEFHYTCMETSTAEDLKFAFKVHRGYGFDGERDGLCRHNVLASYTHVHALGVESWAPSMVRAAVRFRSQTTAPRKCG